MKKFYLLAVALILAAIPTLTAAAAPVKDASTTTPIKHVVWLMQDNHSFDNYFGTYPGADGIPSGVCQRVSLNRKSTRGCVQPFHLGNAAIERHVGMLVRTELVECLPAQRPETEGRALDAVRRDADVSHGSRT